MAYERGIGVQEVCADNRSTSGSSLVSFDYFGFKQRQSLRSPVYPQSRHVDRWHAFGRIRDEVLMSSRNGRERNYRNNQNHNGSHYYNSTLTA